jgi:hypothetical protein
MIDKDMAMFNKVLNSGATCLDQFSTEPRLYELACVSTCESYSEYFDRLLEYGLDPSIEDPSPNRYTFSLLVCSERERNLSAFKK